MTVIKRDNRKVKFDDKKIIKAISSAFSSSKEEHTEEDITSVLNFVLNEIELKKEEEISVEDIQDIVENGLMNRNFYNTARHYILYREERTKERNKKDDIHKEMTKKILGKKNEKQNANVDEDSFGGKQGEASSVWKKYEALNYYMSEKSAKNHNSNRIYQHDLDSYVVGMHNCLSIPFDPLLAEGFNTRQTDVRPASSINTAFQLIAVIFQLQSLQQFGGVSATHLDWTLVPYVKKSFLKHFKDGLKYILKYNDDKVEKIVEKITKVEDNKKELSINNIFIKKRHYKKVYKYAIDMTTKELNQAAEGMYHNLNTLQSRSGNQLPFTSINYGTCTLPEGRMVIKALLEGSIKGVGALHKTAIFPCGIFQKMKGVNDKGSINYDMYQLALKSTAKRLYPNYVNVNWSNDADWNDVEYKVNVINNLNNEQYNYLIDSLQKNKEIRDKFGLKVENDVIVPYDMIPSAIPSTMGCRTYTSKDVTWKEDWLADLINYINFGKKGLDYNVTTFSSSHMKDGRGNIAPATIILPTLAMEARKKAEKSGQDVVEEFLIILEQAIADCKDSLIERFEWICAQSPASAKFMYENNTFYGYKPEEGIKSALRHGSLAIGQLGLAECLQILVGCNHTTVKGMEVAIKIEELFKNKCAEYKEKYRLNFGVYYTPAENLCYTAMKKFQKKYGKIPNVSDREYFTNSIHIPVWEEIDPFKKIDLESKLTGYSSAGCITYVELDGNVNNNLEALETIVDYAMDKDIPYFAINVPADTCLDCGYQGDIGDSCPCCKSENIQHLRRVTGYLTGDYKLSFNLGKQAEADDRYKHSNSLSPDIWKNK